jgi:mannose-6-phosphate isomerase-like protein (cupin superfamily)
MAPVLIESLRDNGGTRSVTRGFFPPGAESLLHYHTQFEETFEVVEGEFTVWLGTTKLTLGAGQSSPKIKSNELHRFKNLTQKNVVANVIIGPGHVGCENATLILAGLEKDGKIDMLYKFKGYNSLWIVLQEMTNTLPTGKPKVIFSILRFLLGRNKIEEMKQDLANKYL